METEKWSGHNGQRDHPSFTPNTSKGKHNSVTSRCSRGSNCRFSADLRQRNNTSSMSRRTRWLGHSSRLLFVCCMLTSLWRLQPSNAADLPSRLMGQFLHITDIHPDEFYINGGTIETSCHRNTTDSDDGGDEDLLHMLRPGRTDGGTGGLYGSPYTICDSPFTLSNATFDWIDKNLIGEIDFVVWTGDNARYYDEFGSTQNTEFNNSSWNTSKHQSSWVPDSIPSFSFFLYFNEIRHDSDNERPRTQQEIEDLNRQIANRFLDTFTPDKDDPYQQRIPIVPSIGNNDVYPHNIMMAGPNRILQHFSDIWSEFIPEDQFHTFQHGGYYTVEVVPGKVSVISLNTLYFFNQNAAVDGCYEKEEPGTDQMDWLVVELNSIRKRGMTVYLSGHVPPARKSYSPTCFVRYTNIALKYQDVIVGHLYGHANIDHFFILSQATLTQEESILEEEWIRKKSSYISSSRSANVDTYEHEFGQFHSAGLSSYLLELWEQYQDIPKRAKLNDYAIVLVSPSVVPTYNPTLRVYAYQLVIEKDGDLPMAISPATTLGETSYEDEVDYRIDFEMDGAASIDFDDLGKKKKKKPRKPRKPRKPPVNPPAAPPTTFGFPLSYTQYWVNLTQANLEQKKPEYVVEYRSQEDWGLQDLGVSEYLSLARRIIQTEDVKEQYLAWMVVQTGTENEHM